MRVLSRRGTLRDVEISEEELVVINNALNEAREFVPRTEFHARIGVGVDAVTTLLGQIQSALESS
jgi:hypothetical protein